jgi:peptidyl-prolyl cis-trans isomerase A (cyclophilin A)
MKPLGILLTTVFLGVIASSPAMGQTAPKANLKPRVLMETSQGPIVLELDRAKAPITVDNFLRYVQDGFYIGLIFHRVIPNFMIQGGGFDENMTVKTTGQHPPIKLESKNGLKNVTGTIAMARTGNPNSATSQFFINVVDNPPLDYPKPDGHGYAVFGKVVEGMDTVEKIRRAKLIRHPKYPARRPVTPETPVVIQKATVVSGKGN